MWLRGVLALVLMAISVAWSGPPAHAQAVVISRSEVFIIASALTDPAGGAAGSPSPGQPVNPIFDPVVIPVDQNGEDHEITIDIPDMDPTSTGPRLGIREGIAAGASVTVIFPQSLGIRNPRQAGAVFVDVATSPPGAPAADVALSISPDTPGAEAEYRVSFTTTADLPADSGTITITLDEDVQLPVAPPENGEETRAADLSVVRTGLPTAAETGATLSYDLRVTNSGPQQATGVTLAETLPPGAALISVAHQQGECRESGGTLTCQLGELGVGQELVVGVELVLDASAVGDFTVTGSVAGVGPDPDPDDNEATSILSVTPPPGATPPSDPTPAAVHTPTPAVTPGPNAAPVQVVTPTPTDAPVPAAAPPQTMTATPTPMPTSQPALAAAPTLAPTSPGESGPGEGPLGQQPSGGFCSTTLGSAPLAAGAANLLFLLAPLAGIWAYRRRRP